MNKCRNQQRKHQEDFDKTTKTYLTKIQEIRAKVAWAEILTFLHPSICIPKIIKLSLYYLKDDFIVKYFANAKINNTELDKQFIKDYIESLKSDGRNSINKQKLSYSNNYGIIPRYKRYIKIIRECRNKNSMEPFYHALFSIRRSQKDDREGFVRFSNRFKDRILGEKRDVAEMTIEILEWNDPDAQRIPAAVLELIGGIEEITISTDVLRKSNSKVNRLIRKGYSMEQVEMLSLPLSRGESLYLYHSNSFSVLEKL